MSEKLLDYKGSNLVSCPSTVPIVLIIVAIALMTPVEALAQTYRVVDLGHGPVSYAQDISDNGTIVGCFISDHITHFFVLGHNSTFEAGPMGGNQICAIGVNNRGEVTGSGRILGDFAVRAFLYRNDVLQLLPTIETGRSDATDINDRGDIVGQALIAFPNSVVPVLYKNGEIINLGIPAGAESGSAVAINNSGQIALYISFGQGLARFFIYEKGTFQDGGTLGGRESIPTRINNRGQVVGYSHTNAGSLHAFLYEHGFMTDLGDLGGGQSVARGVNERGHVVGTSNRTDGTMTTFIWARGEMKDLNLSLIESEGWYISEAAAINNSGEIVGTGLIDGESHAILLVPVSR